MPIALRAQMVITLSIRVLIGATIAGCASGLEPLMPTPVLYHDPEIDPFAHVPDSAMSQSLPLFFATLRVPGGPVEGTPYENELGNVLRLGSVRVRIGDEGTTWEEIHRASTREQRDRPLHLYCQDIQEMALLDVGPVGTGGLTPDRREFADAVAEGLATTRCGDIVVYVHGTKVSLYRAAARAGQLVHFTGRDHVGVVFDWPSHQSILSYVLGPDHARARAAAPPLATLLAFLAEHTSARQIHVVCYSAGAIATASAVAALRERNESLGPDDLQRRYRLGTVFFAAGDVPLEEFLRELPAIHDMAERVMVSASDADRALSLATSWMGGGRRIGTESRKTPEEERRILERAPRAEILDVSWGSEERGFDIAGHHYWYEHPWVSSDVILSLRTELSPQERALSPAAPAGIWYLPSGYPERVRERLRTLLRDR